MYSNFSICGFNVNNIFFFFILCIQLQFWIGCIYRLYSASCLQFKEHFCSHLQLLEINFILLPCKKFIGDNELKDFVSITRTTNVDKGFKFRKLYSYRKHSKRC